MAVRDNWNSVTKSIFFISNVQYMVIQLRVVLKITAVDIFSEWGLNVLPSFAIFLAKNVS